MTCQQLIGDLKHTLNYRNFSRVEIFSVVETPRKHFGLFEKKLWPTFFAPTAFWSNKNNIPPIVESLFHRNLGTFPFLTLSLKLHVVACSSTVLIKNTHSYGTKYEPKDRRIKKWYL